MPTMASPEHHHHQQQPQQQGEEQVVEGQQQQREQLLLGEEEEEKEVMVQQGRLPPFKQQLVLEEEEEEEEEEEGVEEGEEERGEEIEEGAEEPLRQEQDKAESRHPPSGFSPLQSPLGAPSPKTPSDYPPLIEDTSPEPVEGEEEGEEGREGEGERGSQPEPDSIPSPPRSFSRAPCNTGEEEVVEGGREEEKEGEGKGKGKAPPLCVSASDVPTVSACLLDTAKTYVALILWLGLFHVNVLALALIVSFWPHPAAVAGLALFLTLLLWPVRPDSALGQRVARFVATNGPKYFPIKVVFEDKAALDPSKAYVVAFEPHSILPVGAMVCCPASGLFPLRNVRVLGSSALDWVPLCRHVWRWLGMGAASRSSFARLLANGVSCVIVPGGMQESLLIEREREVLYLKHRKGFVRMALSAGVPIVPVFAFGQRLTFKWSFPRSRWHTRLSRTLLFAPMAFWGVWGSPIPYRHPVTVVVGAPIPTRVESNSLGQGNTDSSSDSTVVGAADSSTVSDGLRARAGAKGKGRKGGAGDMRNVDVSDEPGGKVEAQVGAVHAEYLERVASLYEKYKVMAGAGDVPLEIL